jgi:mannose-6-phosphate isomerase-like protein (cupin superfamily)
VQSPSGPRRGPEGPPHDPRASYGVAMPLIIPLADLSVSPTAALFEGRKRAGVDVSFFATDHAPGGGPGLHKHPYAEVFVVQEGEATFTVNEERVHVAAGNVVVVPADTPHRFENTGDGRLRQVAIHVSGELIQFELG